MPRPLVAISPDLYDRDGTLTVRVTTHYADRVHAAGGLPILLPHIAGDAPEAIERFDAFVFTGGDDPFTEPFGEPTHTRITPVLADRQAYETKLLSLLDQARPDTPVLGVCLGMQMMALVARGRLDQYMPESTVTHAEHWNAEHPIEPVGGTLIDPGTVHSKHKQAVADPGRLEVLARAHDGVIEAVGAPSRRFWIGVQWHPERTCDHALGQGLFDRLVEAAR